MNEDFEWQVDFGVPSIYWTPDNGVRLVTPAPELPNALDMIRTLATRGVVVSTGHSLAANGRFCD